MRELNRNNRYNYAVFFAFAVGVFLVEVVFVLEVDTVFLTFAETVSDDDALISFALVIGVIFGAEVADST